MLRKFLQEQARLMGASDLEHLNRDADQLNSEAVDVMDYQDCAFRMALDIE